MRITTYPKQDITVMADAINRTPPEAVIIDEASLAEEIIARLDDQDYLNLETGDNELFIFADVSIRWEETEAPDMSVGYYGASKPWITDIVIQAFLPDENDSDQIGEQIEAKYCPFAVRELVWRKY